jgi:replication factor A1
LRHKRSVGEYLAFLSIKYEVDPEKFLYALNTAKEHRKAKCEELAIQYRGKTRNNFIFLIERDREVIAQFPIDEDFLLNRDNQLRNFMETDKIRRYLSKKNKTTHSHSIRDLRSGMTHVNLQAKIWEVADSKHVVTRYGNNASVAKVLIGDETGTIKLCLWNGQIAAVSTGDTVQIENARVSAFRGERQLNLGKKGTLSNVEVFKPQATSIDSPTPSI